MRRVPKTKLQVAGTPLAQQAYDAVRGAIERGELSPGDRISEYRIADWLKISRTPAREGLLRLEAEGLLAYRPRRGLIVASIDDQALKELFLAREELERALAGMAAQNASRPEIDAVLRLSDAEPELVDDLAGMYEHNKLFHRQIRSAAHNRYLMKCALALDDVVAADRRGSSLIDPQRRRAVLVEHRRLAEAIAARDVARAEECAVAHIRAAYAARVKNTPQPSPNAATANAAKRRRAP
jgi:DNA-binding GntR family transcriptional regulator